MTTFIYHGVDLTIDVAYSYARVSTAQQTIEHGGEGIARQIDLFQIFCEQYGVTVDHNLTDLAKSGSKGQHLEEGGALAVFMELATTKKLKPNAALIVESFSRLSRLPIDLALRLFLDIIGSGCTLITLADHNAYTRATLRRNHGQIYQVSSAMQAARAEAEAKAFYATQSWQRRRGSAKSVYPAWITCEDGRLIPDPVKAAVVDRCWHMALEMGVTQICQILNSEGVPVLDGRKRKRGILVWNPGSLIRHLRSRQVLGEQLVGHYVDGKRHTNGEYIQGYPPVISEELWQAVQVKLDSRRQGVGTGRNVTNYTNLFGDLARCECGERMKVQGRGKHGPYRYLGCSAAPIGGCDNRKFYRLDKIEHIVLPRIADEVIDDTPRDDPTVTLQRQITRAKADASQIVRAYERAMFLTGELAERTAAKLGRDHADKRAEIGKLERRLAEIQSGSPASELQRTVRTVLGAALTGDVTARAKIADALPGLLKTPIVCRKDGTLRVDFGSIGRNATLAWTLTLPNAYWVAARYDAQTRQATGRDGDRGALGGDPG